MKHLFIINGKAGKGQGCALIPAIEKAFIDKKEDFLIKGIELAFPKL